MTRGELEEELAVRYWKRIQDDYPDEFVRGAPVPETVLKRIHMLVEDMYELGVIVDVLDRAGAKGNGNKTWTVS